jgi:hypothetical protein
MKKLLLLVLFGALGLSPVWADSTIPADPPAKPDIGTWVFQINSETGFPTGRLNNVVNEGWGAQASFGYRFPQNITLSLEGGYMGYSAKSGVLNTTWAALPFMLVGQYSFSSGTIQPYVFLGAGMAFNSQASSFAGTAAENDFLEEAGLGISFALVTQTYLFVQSKVEVDNTSSAYAPDQPTVLIPLDVGLTIQVN